MVDRRSLVVGGGAAALAVVAGAISPAAASTTARSATTPEHARRVLGTLKVELGLVDLKGAQSRLKEAVAGYLASEPRDPKADDLYAWAEGRVADLTGRKDAFGTALIELRETRSLLGFFFALYTQHQDLRLPAMTRSMPVPAVLARLESDFFPEILGQMDDRAKGDQAFAGLVEAGSAELDRIIAGLAEGSGPMSVQAGPRPWSDLIIAGALAIIVGVAVYLSEK